MFFCLFGTPNLFLGPIINGHFFDGDYPQDRFRAIKHYPGCINVFFGLMER